VAGAGVGAGVGAGTGAGTGVVVVVQPTRNSASSSFFMESP
jgi:hypothetical protein